MKPTEEQIPTKPIDMALEEMIACVRDFCLETSFHGFMKVVKSRYRIVWVLLLIVSTAYTFKLVHDSFVTYYNYEVNSNIKMIFQSPMDFPAISFCNMNPFEQLNQTTTMYLNNILEVNGIQEDSLTNHSTENLMNYIGQVSSLVKAHVSADCCLSKEERFKIGYSLDQMMLSCIFDNRPCNESDFFYFRDNQYGNCYTFNFEMDNSGNYKASKQVAKAGMKSGLALELFTGVNDLNTKYLAESGIVLAIHERDRLPLFFYEGIALPLSYSTSIAMKKTTYSRLGPPYSSCGEVAPSEVKSSGRSKFEYHQRICWEHCLNNMVIKKRCGCLDANAPQPPLSTCRNDSIKMCISMSDLKCVADVREEFKTFESITRVCDESMCPMQCNGVQFSKSYRLATYPTGWYTNMLLKQADLNEKLIKTLEENMNPSSGKRIGCYPYLDTGRKPNYNGPGGPGGGPNGGGGKGPPIRPSLLEAEKRKQITGLIEGSTLRFNIYFESLIYQRIYESPAIDAETLYALIGGQISLFIGASFLTFVEVIEMLINLMIIISRFFKPCKQD